MSHYVYLIFKDSFTCNEFKSEEEAIRLTTNFLDTTELDRDSLLIVFSETKLSKDTIDKMYKEFELTKSNTYKEFDHTEDNVDITTFIEGIKDNTIYVYNIYPNSYSFKEFLIGQNHNGLSDKITEATNVEEQDSLITILTEDKLSDIEIYDIQKQFGIVVETTGVTI
jgi:hypothetical protein